MVEVVVGKKEVEPNPPKQTYADVHTQWFETRAEPPKTFTDVSETVMFDMGPLGLAASKTISFQLYKANLRAYLAKFADLEYEGKSLVQLVYTGPAGRRLYVYTSTDGREWEEEVTSFNNKGYAYVNIFSKEPAVVSLVASLRPMTEFMLGRKEILSLLPLVDYRLITFWLLRVRTTPISDRWARWQGRAIWRQPLPCQFWFPHHVGYTTGLAGGVDWYEVVPAVTGIGFKYQVGVSAWCNTPDPYPPMGACCEARKNTWWKAEIYAKKGPRDKWGYVGGDKINISFHITAEFNTDGYSYKGRCVCEDVACTWEQGGSC